jgi:hypothetical protein
MNYVSVLIIDNCPAKHNLYRICQRAEGTGQKASALWQFDTGHKALTFYVSALLSVATTVH